MRDRWQHALVDRGGGLALAVLLFYLASAGEHIADGDNAELALLGAVGGVAHPTGYPITVLWLRAWSWLPAASPAQSAAYATAILGALAAWCLYRACRAWGAGTLAATLAAGLYAASPLVARYASEAEVFTGNQLVAAGVLWLAAARGPVRGMPRVLLLAVIAGLGMANHMTCVLVAPVGLLGAVRGVRESRRRALVVVAAALGALAVGLLPYAYLFVAPPGDGTWSPIHDARDLLRLVLREDYGGPGGFSPVAGTIDVGANLAALVQTLGRGWWWIFGLCGLAELGRRCAGRADATAEPRGGWIALAIAFGLAGPLLVARFNVDPHGLGLYGCQRFHLLPLLLLAPAIACGIDAVLAYTPASPRSVASVALVFALVATAAVRSLPEVAAKRTPAFELGARHLLESLEPHAVLILSDELSAAAIYEQRARGLRRDIQIVTWPLASGRWYRERLAAEGVDIAAGAAGDPTPASVRLATAQLAAGRPVYVDAYEDKVLTALPSYPFGVVFRVLPAGSALPTPERLAADNARLFDSWQLAYAPPGADDDFATMIHDRYAQTWLIIARAQRDPEVARTALEYARRFGVQP